MHVVVRTDLAAGDAGAVIAAAAGFRSGFAGIAHLGEMDEVFTQCLMAQLLTLYSALALVLAAIAASGVLAFMVTNAAAGWVLAAEHWARNIGGCLRQVMTQGLTPAGLGIAIGLAGAFGLSRFLAFVFAVEPVDAVTRVTVAGIAALACWLPAWRASRFNSKRRVARQVEGVRRTNR